MNEEHPTPNPLRTIAVSGATGLVGRHLVVRLTDEGRSVRTLVRREPRNKDVEIQWNPERGIVDAVGLSQVDAVVHLAGENISHGRWTTAKKERIRSSRVEGTRLLCDALASLDTKPRVLVCASAIGYYGDRGDKPLDETSSPGEGFLSEVCQAWEAATEPARDAGIRVVNLRLGVVLSPEGGALRKMLTPFRAGIGGVVGGGAQYISWIALDDAVQAIFHVLECEKLSGPVNAVAPHSVTNHNLTKTLGRALNRPTLFPMPAFAARLAFGEMADELLLSSARVRPSRLNETGFLFAYPELDAALTHLLKEP